MKVAVYSESEADDAALRILAEGILGMSIEPVPHVGLRQRGWPSVLDTLKPVLLQLHYHTEADGFIMVVDSNGSEPHRATHEKPNAHPRCRLCQLRQIREEVFQQLKARPDRTPMKMAFGLAVPSIEAWFRCDQDYHVNEAAWLNGLASRQPPYTTAVLKRQLYDGTDRPSLALEKRCMTEAAKRLAQNLAHLEASFPNGFKVFANELRQWNANKEPRI